MANHGADTTHEPKGRYDVFLSFRGEDTRYTFAGSLYDALRRKGFNTFMDDVGLKGGDQISESLVKAIEESRISIVVFSKNYASSSWCLDELVKIVECMKVKNQLVWPIFYKVEPSDVRHQRKSYKEAMDKHEERFGKNSEKVQKWRSALSDVANLKGLPFEIGYEYEYEFIQKIVELATNRLHREQLYVGEHVIGHRSRIEEVRSLLDIESRNTVCMVGIHGSGGMGKTTLAKALYNLIVDQFECAIFLESVRERSNSYKGMVRLQEAILSQLFERRNIKLGSVGEGATSLKDRLCRRRVLLVLDDVDCEDQLEKLAGECNWFGLGSRIIITTRDKHVLNVHQVEKSYEMKMLNDREALQLFCWNAFKLSQPARNYEDVSNRAVRYANGLPLALKVIGSNLVSKSVEEFECALKQYERTPERKIQNILKISYDCLPDNAKYIFLDICFFFKGESMEYVKEILDKCEFFPAWNIGILVDKSLLTVDEYGHLWMHDLIQGMGREIVRQEAPSKPGERSRLYFHEDVLQVLTEDSGNRNIQGIILDPPEEEEVEWSGTALQKMDNLRILIIRNACFSSGPNYLPNSLRLLDWEGYPSESLPNYPKNVVVLRLPYSHLRLEKEKPLPKLKHLTDIGFQECRSITHIPDVSGAPNLRKVHVTYCENLVEVHHSVGFLKYLESLNVECCTKLRTFPRRVWLPSLRYLGLMDTSIEFFPDVEGVIDMPLAIDLEASQIQELPHSVGYLTGLKGIKMPLCFSLRDLTCNLFMLPTIAVLSIGYNHEVQEAFRRFGNGHVIARTMRHLNFPNDGLTDEDLHFMLSCFPDLEVLIVSTNNFVSLPAIIGDFAKLRVLDVSDSTNLQEIPELPLSIQEVHAGRCPSFTSETSRMLWSLAFKEVYKLRVYMPWPREQIPDWFDHRCEGGILSFWARGRKIPAVALAFTSQEGRPQPIEIQAYINGVKEGRDYIEFIFWEGDSAVILCDVRRLFRTDEWPILNASQAPEWNYVEVKAGFDWLFFGPCPIARYCGAYVYRQETNMEDIQFTCPALKIGDISFP